MRGLARPCDDCTRHDTTENVGSQRNHHRISCQAVYWHMYNNSHLSTQRWRVCASGRASDALVLTARRNWSNAMCVQWTDVGQADEVGLMDPTVCKTYRDYSHTLMQDRVVWHPSMAISAARCQEAACYAFGKRLREPLVGTHVRDCSSVMVVQAINRVVPSKKNRVGEKSRDASISRTSPPPSSCWKKEVSCQQFNSLCAVWSWLPCCHV